MTAKAASISVKIESNNYESNCDSGSEYMDLSSPDDSGEDDALGKVENLPAAAGAAISKEIVREDWKHLRRSLLDGAVPQSCGEMTSDSEALSRSTTPSFPSMAA